MFGKTVKRMFATTTRKFYLPGQSSRLFSHPMSSSAELYFPESKFSNSQVLESFRERLGPRGCLRRKYPELFSNLPEEIKTNYVLRDFLQDLSLPHYARQSMALQAMLSSQHPGLEISTFAKWKGSKFHEGLSWGKDLLDNFCQHVVLLKPELRKSVLSREFSSLVTVARHDPAHYMKKFIAELKAFIKFARQFGIDVCYYPALFLSADKLYSLKNLNLDFETSLKLNVEAARYYALHGVGKTKKLKIYISGFDGVFSFQDNSEYAIHIVREIKRSLSEYDVEIESDFGSTKGQMFSSDAALFLWPEFLARLEAEGVNMSHVTFHPHRNPNNTFEENVVRTLASIFLSIQRGVRKFDFNPTGGGGNSKVDKAGTVLRGEKGNIPYSVIAGVAHVLGVQLDGYSDIFPSPIFKGMLREAADQSGQVNPGGVTQEPFFRNVTLDHFHLAAELVLNKDNKLDCSRAVLLPGF